MKRFASGVAVVALASACASMAPAPTGMEAGKFVTFDCDGGDFQARWNPDTSTVRVRSHHGSAELDKAADGSFRGDGFELVSASGAMPTLAHGGKVISKNCRRA
jgi:hypothetical protein